MTGIDTPGDGHFSEWVESEKPCLDERRSGFKLKQYTTI